MRMPAFTSQSNDDEVCVDCVCVEGDLNDGIASQECRSSRDALSLGDGLRIVENVLIPVGWLLGT